MQQEENFEEGLDWDDFSIPALMGQSSSNPLLPLDQQKMKLVNNWLNENQTQLTHIPSDGSNKPPLVESFDDDFDLFEEQEDDIFSSPTNSPLDSDFNNTTCQDNVGGMIGTSFLSQNSHDQTTSSEKTLVFDSHPFKTPTPQHSNISSPALSKRFLSSPTPSSSASMIASESGDDEGFDEIEFPSSGPLLLHVNLPGTNHSSDNNSSLVLANSNEDNLEDDLIIPDGMQLDQTRLLKSAKTSSIQTKKDSSSQLEKKTIDDTAARNNNKASRSRQGTNSSTTTNGREVGVVKKRPEMIDILPPPQHTFTTKIPLPTPVKKTIATQPPTPRPTSSRSYNTTKSTSKRSFASPTLSHLLKSRSNVTTVPLTSTPSATPRQNDLLTKPKKLQKYEENISDKLDSISDLKVNPAAEARFMKPTLSSSLRRVGNNSNKSNSSPRTQAFRRQAATAAANGNGVNYPAPLHRTHLQPSNSKPSSSTNNTSKKFRNSRVPTLIRNMNTTQKPTGKGGSSTTTSAGNERETIVGEMRYDPNLKTWVGNEDVLLEFERVLENQPSTTTRKTIKPELITNIKQTTQQNYYSKKGDYYASSSQEIDDDFGCAGSSILGRASESTTMKFDPVAMKWVGNEKEDVLDIFDDDEDDEKEIVDVIQNGQRLLLEDISPAVDDNKKEVHISEVGDFRSSSRNVDLITTSTRKDDGGLVKSGEEEFIIREALKAEFYTSENNHKLFVGSWYQKANRSSHHNNGSGHHGSRKRMSKSHLYEIRNLLL